MSKMSKKWQMSKMGQMSKKKVPGPFGPGTT